MSIRTLRTWVRNLLARPGAPAERRRPRLDELEPRVNPANPYQVADINVLATTVGSSPTSIVDMNGIAYFVATDAVHGPELWKSDGTAAGTMMVKDIRPGIVGSNISQMTVVNGTLYFTATTDDTATGGGLWKSDGTAAGTVKVFSGGPSLGQVAGLNGMLLFQNWTAATGYELWNTDGTEAGTALVKDINPGSGSSNPSTFVVCNGTLYFGANDAFGNSGLWKSDGTAAGTVLVKDIDVSAGRSTMLAVNDTLFLAANDVVHGIELWKSDGTDAGTVLVKDINPGSTNWSNPNQLTNVNGTLYFTANDGTTGQELWKSDGTEAGTVLVQDIRPGTSSPNAHYLTNVGGTLYFSADDGSIGYELWKSDGTAAGTVLVKDIRPGAVASRPLSLTPLNGAVYFSADNGGNGRELWTSDGTAAGTVMVTELRPDFYPGLPGPIALVGGTLFFLGNDGAHGEELWTSDGTAAGTVLVKDIVFGTAASHPRDFVDVNATAFFLADDGVHGYELWKSDGTAAGTVLVKDIRPGTQSSYVKYMTDVNGTLFFRADDGVHGLELWKSDGTEAGTVLVKDINPGTAYSAMGNPAVLNGVLYFSARTAANGFELWKSDGTDAGTVLVKDIHPGTAPSYPDALAVMNGTLYFGADDGVTGRELWQSNGTEAGTVLVKDIYPGSYSGFPKKLTPVGGVLYFEAADSATGKELWKTDGTAAGTVLVKDINPGTAASSPVNLTPVGSTLYFQATTAAAGQELWMSDGTAAGTIMVKDILPGIGSSQPQDLTARNGTVLFYANDGVNGEELWTSDGTADGTAMVKDINPGAAFASPRDLTLVGDTVYFGADDGASGRELWKTDGTAAGTALVSQIVPGSGASTPTRMAAVGGRLYFAATTEAAGEELWALSPPGPVPSVSFTAATQSAAESAGTMTVSARLSAVQDQDVTVPFTVGGTATAGADYTISASPITIPAGSLTASATITLIDDSTDEPDETVVVTMGVPTNAVAGAVNIHTATITDDDSAPTVSFAVAGGSAAEPVATCTVTVSLSAASALPITVPFTVSGTATNPDDYTLAPDSPLTFAPGETSKSITITVVDDTEIEPDETVVLDLGAPTNATMGATTTYMETITDDDSGVTVSFGAAGGSAAEGVATRTVTVTLSGPLPFPVTVPYTVSGTATSPDDYSIAPPSPLTFAPGETNKTITITVVDDTLVEADETVVLTLGTPTNAGLGATTTYTETIVDDEPTPTVAFATAAGSAPEGVATRTVTVVLSGPSTLPITVPYSVSGTATSPEDYSISPASPLAFAPGETSKTITITVVDDTLVESDETVILTLGTPTNATTGAPAEHTETIEEEIGITVSPPSKTYTTEGGGTLTFTVVLTAIPTADVVIPVASSDLTEATVSAAQLVFTPATAGVPQTVTVTGLDDGVVDLNHLYSVLLGPAQSGDARFNGLDPADISLVNVEFLPKGKRSFVDTDGDKYTVRLTGPGQVGVIQGGSGVNGPGPIDQIVLSPAVDPLRSRLYVTVQKVRGGDGLVDIGTATGPGIRSFTAAKSDLTGAGVILDGYLGALVVRDIRNEADVLAGGTPDRPTAITAADVGDGTTIAVGSRITTLRVARFGAGQITAPRIGTLSVTGNAGRAIPADFVADVRVTGALVPPTANALGSLVVGGTIRGSAIEVAGNVGSVRAKAVVDSSLLLGQNATMQAGFKLGSFTVTGYNGSTDPTYVDSQVTADRIGRVILKSVGTAHPDVAFGVTAGTSLGSVRVATPAFLYDPHQPSPQGLNLDQDPDLEFVVRVG